MATELSFAFTIFFLTLGPIKTVPAFGIITADLDPAARRWLAVRGVVLGTLIVFATAIVLQGVMKSWRVSAPAMEIAGALLLFISAAQTVAGGLGQGPAAASPSPPAQKGLDDEVKARALSPIAVPSIVTPVGIAAILVIGDAAENDTALLYQVYGMLAVIMALNLVGMLLARSILKLVSVLNFRLVGWTMSVLQAGLAVEFILSALRTLKIVPAQGPS
jgi:multiple antibiotic resistance protein